MRSAAEAIKPATGRLADPLDQVDYRLAQTPEQKDEIYRLRYRAYLREGAIRPEIGQTFPLERAADAHRMGMVTIQFRMANCCPADSRTIFKSTTRRILPLGIPVKTGIHR